MSAPRDSWQDANQRFLTAALQWLRLRLGRHERRQQPGARPEADVALDAAASALATVEREVDPPPALAILASRLGLSRFERDVLLLCVAMELDTRIAGLCARALDDPARPYPTFALALARFDDPAWDVLSPHRPLRFWRLLEITQPGAQPLTTSALRADERIVNYVKGLNYLDDRLMQLVQPLDHAADTHALPPSQQRLVERIIETLRRGPQGSRIPVVQLLGADSASKLLVVRHVAAALGQHVYRMPLALLPSHTGDLETLVRLWHRESLLLPVALYLEQPEVDAPTAGEATQSQLALTRRFIARTDGLLFVDTREGMRGLAEPSLMIDVAKPSPVEQEATWQGALGPLADRAPALAAQFDLAVTTIHEIAATVGDASASDAGAQVWDACLSRTRPRLDALAQRLDPKATWDDLVLPSDEIDLLRAIGHQVRHRSTVYETWGFRRRMNRGLGISALFAGDSGTGKTMAAEVIANDLRLNLYRIDLSGVVSKYIGETEKNVRTLFDAAEDGGAILFFDEADALFGKRSEVRDSHDRYANIEVDYLLQRMEAYRGVAILATNMKSALDPAFLRRLRFIVTFPYPGPAERKHIWERAFPESTPTAALDFDRLARLHLTGGSIHNIALNAAFLAAQAGSAVTMALVLNAARAEFKKLERPVNESEFRCLEPAGCKG